MIWAFCSHIDLCIVQIYISTWNVPTIFYQLRAHELLHVFLRLFWCSIQSIGVEFVLGTKRTLKRNLTISKLFFYIYMFYSFSLLIPVFEPRHDKTNKMSLRPAKTQISLGIRPVWSESSLCAQWVAKGLRFLHADSKYSDQTHFVGFVMSRLIYYRQLSYPENVNIFLYQLNKYTWWSQVSTFS